jgi:UDP-2,4-diacetamido-2,4,6-trideoxy-beta-L-altropyranose hydrolase
MTDTLLLRADAGTRIGTGHLMRCLTLAERWIAGGGRALLASVGLPVPLRPALDRLGVEAVSLPSAPDLDGEAAALAALADREAARWITLDGYQFDSRYQEKLRAAGHRLLLVDDYGQADRYAANLVLNQNLGARPELYAARSRETRLLLGPRYALLRREFAAARRRPRSDAAGPLRLLVTLGGSDPENVTGRLLEGLRLLPPETLGEATVVLGGANPHAVEASPQDPRFRLHRNVAAMGGLMAAADLAIAAGGTTVWELCCLGTPMLLLTLAVNQAGNCAELAAAGIARHLGRPAEATPEGIADAVADLAARPDLRAEMGRRARALVDGEGARRVWLHLQEETLALRDAAPEDARLIWEWASDPAVRAVSFTSDPIPWDSHLRWYAARLQDPQSLFWLGCRAGHPVGQVRFDLSGNRAVISVSLDPEARGKGLGALLIWKACRALFAARPIAAVTALIKPGNPASARAFEKADFRLQGEREERGQPTLIFTLEREDVAP